MIQSVAVEIEGITPLLMHKYPMVEIVNPPLEKRPIPEQAELAAYRYPDESTEGKLYVPGIAIQRCLVDAAAYSKGKGRASLQKSAAACIMVTPDRVFLDKQQYEIDSRPVVIPSTKGRVMRHRPRFDSWKLAFEVEYDDSLIIVHQLNQIVDDAGKRVGLLDFRPAHKGPFGRFIIAKWEPQTLPVAKTI